jgi:hypothetical protein
LANVLARLPESFNPWQIQQLYRERADTESWRAACGMTTSILGFNFEMGEEARGVTDPGVGCTGWFALFLPGFSKLTLEVVWVLPLLNETKHEKTLTLEMVVHQVRERHTLSASKSMGTEVIATISNDNRSNRLPHPRIKVISQLGGDRCITRLGIKQVPLKDRAEPYSHGFSPKTSSKDIPGSRPDFMSSSLERSSSQI